MKSVNKSPLKERKRYVTYLLRVSVVIVIALVAIFVVFLVQFNISQNVENRVFTELKSTSELQKSALVTRLNEQYLPLYAVDELLEDGEVFASNQMRPTLKALIETHTLCTLAFADLDGNTTDYEGNLIGNISDREYFFDIVNGTAANKCEYLATTKAMNEPRVLFSIPAHDKSGKLIGVLFCSKEINVLEKALFRRYDFFDSSADIFVCDTEGEIIAASDSVYGNAFVDSSTNSIFNKIPALEDMYHSGVESTHININGSKAYATLSSLQINDWQLGCIVQEDTAIEAYAPNLDNIRSLAISVSVIFIVAMGYIIFLLYLDFYRRRREIGTIKRYYENYKTLLHELNCSVVEYDTETDMVCLLDDFEDSFGISEWMGEGRNFERIHTYHPEFDFNELEKEIDLVQKNRRTYSFESIVQVNNEPRWVKVLLIPVLNEERVLHVLGVAIDITNMHQDFEAVADMFMQVPGGVCRCRLSAPSRLEYFSEGLCKMLKYSGSEIRAIIGPEQDYSHLVFQEDRPKFNEFMQDLAIHGGSQTCEYRMICKDGMLLTVSDTMDAQRSSSGVMYGYCVVTDLQKYKQVQAELETELAATKEHLEELRMKNFASQMQPHFLYNALASIREIVLDEPEYASDLIYDFTTHLRACLRSIATDTQIPFQQELDNINAYVNIEKMRFGTKLSIQYECSETNFLIIPLSIQPLVENAIRHGIYERGENGGVVIIRSYQTDHGVDIQVEDNGVGFDFEKTMQEVKNGTRDSTGLFNLIFRFEKIMKATVTVKSQYNVGTTVTVSIPIEEKANESHIS